MLSKRLLSIAAVALTAASTVPLMTRAAELQPFIAHQPQGDNVSIDAGDTVKDAQQALKDEGLYEGPINGKWGPDTKRALEQFQRKNGLRQTAELDGETQEQLVHADND